MALPTGAIIECTLFGTMLSQRIMSVYHYRVSAQSSLPLVTTELTAFLDAVTLQVATSLLGSYQLAVPSNYNIQGATAQAISPQRSIRMTNTQNLAGARPTSVTANMASALTLRTDLGGRSFVGRKSLPISDQDVSNGLIGLLYTQTLSDHGQAILDNVVPSQGGGIYEPVIFHRPPSVLPPTRILSADPQDTARVSRRRTLGVGI